MRTTRDADAGAARSVATGLLLVILVILGATSSCAPSSTADETPATTTPLPEDVPRPVPGETSVAGSARPDVTRFLNVRAARSPGLSPDGMQLAFVTDITGSPQLWVADVVVGELASWPRQLTFGEDGIRFHAWSPRGDWLVYGADRAGDEREGFYLIRPDGLEETELLPPSRAFRLFGGFSPDGRLMAYATTTEGGTSFDIHLLDVLSGEDRKVFEGRMGLSVASWHPHGEGLLVRETRGEDGADLYYLDLATDSLVALLQPEERADYRSFAWRPDGKGFYLVTDQDRDLAALSYYDLEQRKLEPIETPDAEVELASLDPTGRYLIWTTNEAGRSVLHGEDLRRRRSLRTPSLPAGVYGASRSQSPTCDGSTESVTWAAGTSRAAFSLCSSQTRSDIWIWDMPRRIAWRATESATGGLHPRTFVSPEHLEFEARDGVTLRGLLYMPHEIPDAGKPPLLLAVHGGPTSQARPTFRDSHQYLLSRGIAVFDLNYRGSTGYGKTFARLDDGRGRPNAVQDMADALDFLSRDGRVDTTRAAVMGGSYGGYLTFAAMTDLPGRFRAGVSFVGVSNWVSALEGASPTLKASDRLEYGDIDDPDDRRFFAELSPLARVHQVTAPMMVVHGANDPRDPVSESDQFVAAIRSHGGEVEYLRFPDEGHTVRKLSNRIITYRRVAAFLERVLEVEAPAS